MIVANTGNIMLATISELNAPWSLNLYLAIANAASPARRTTNTATSPAIKILFLYAPKISRFPKAFLKLARVKRSPVGIEN